LPPSRFNVSSDGREATTSPMTECDLAPFTRIRTRVPSWVIRLVTWRTLLRWTMFRPLWPFSGGCVLEASGRAVGCHTAISSSVPALLPPTSASRVFRRESLAMPRRGRCSVREGGCVPIGLRHPAHRPAHWAVNNRLVGPDDAAPLVQTMAPLRRSRPGTLWVDATGPIPPRSTSCAEHSVHRCPDMRRCARTYCVCRRGDQFAARGSMRMQTEAPPRGSAGTRTRWKMQG
jgi:hypothetical protein